MSDYSKLPPIAVSLGGFAFNGEHIEYWKTQATKADREIASLRAQLAEEKAAVSALNGDVHRMGQQLASARKALETISNPIGHFQERAKAEGRQIDGYAAVCLSRDPEYLRGIARAALTDDLRGEK